MLPLRWAAHWRLASVVLLILVLLAGIAPAFWLWDDRSNAMNFLAHIDKWAHALTFAFLALWFCGQYTRSAYWRIAAGLLVYGIVIEGLQRLVGYRTADVLDVMANLGGIGLGLTIGLLWAGGWSQSVERWIGRRYEHAD